MIPKRTNEPTLREAIQSVVQSDNDVENILIELTVLFQKTGGFTIHQILKIFNSYEWGKHLAHEFKNEFQNGSFKEAFKTRQTTEKLQKEYKRFILDAPQKKFTYIDEPKIKIEKKDVLTELIYREIGKLDEILQVLKDLKIVVPDEGYSLSESDAFCWIEEKPNKEEKKRVLTALGYDVSML